MNIQVIRAGIEHLEQVVPLFDAYRMFYRQSSDREAARKFLKERFEQQDTVLYLAICNQVPAGFAHLFPFFTSVGLKNHWILNDLYVDAAFRSQGVGHLLIEACKQHAIQTEAKGLFLQTEKKNIKAQKFYLTEGFIEDTENVYFEWEIK
jgi:GNAT superfamily N-acetyltransferase